MTKPDDIIRASEIGEYLYCARSWWLQRVQGVSSRNQAALRQGEEIHDQHGRLVAMAQWQRRLALLLAGVGAIMALLAIGLLLAGARL